VANDPVTDAAGEEILGSRALNYRKVTIAISIVLLGMYAFQSINFSGLNVLGLRFDGEPQEQRAAVLWIAWVFLIYHAVFFGYYTWRDSRFWVHKLTKRPANAGNPYPYFPEVRMYFGWAPRVTKAFREMEGDWKRSVNRNQAIMWSPVRPEGVDPRDPAYAMVQYTVPETIEKLLCARLRWFFLVDAGVPALLILAAVVLAVFRG